jgi:hypothetical protein
MTLLEELTAHKGGLVCLKTELFWYGGRGWDGVHDRICLLMDSAVVADRLLTQGAGQWDARAFAASTAVHDAAAILLLIDGRPHWVWVGANDLELL